MNYQSLYTVLSVYMPNSFSKKARPIWSGLMKKINFRRSLSECVAYVDGEAEIVKFKIIIGRQVYQAYFVANANIEV